MERPSGSVRVVVPGAIPTFPDIVFSFAAFVGEGRTALWVIVAAGDDEGDAREQGDDEETSHGENSCGCCDICVYCPVS